MRRLIRAIICAASMLSLADSLYAQSAGAELSRTINVDIGPQKIATALIQLSHQAGIQVLMPGAAVDNLRTAGVHGAMTVEQAVKKLLEGTSLGFRSVGPNAIGIEVPASTTPAPTTPAPAPAATATQDDADVVVVTGSHIPGTVPASPVITIGAVEIERSGYSAPGEVLRRLPQSFGGGQNSTERGSQLVASSGNVGFSDSANLRGFGSDSTLVLIDGQRLAASGAHNSTDISAIPLSAIERVEVLTDGASAVYGSDAVGGVVNFVLKRHFDGFETTAEQGASSQGGGGVARYNQLAGGSWSGGNALLNYQYFKQDDLSAADREVSRAANQPFALTPNLDQHTVFLSANQALGGRVSLSGNAVYSDRDGDQISSFDTLLFGQQGEERQLGGTLGLRAVLAGNWLLTASGSAAENRVRSRLTIEDLGQSLSDSTQVFENHTRNFEIGAGGPLLRNAAGALSVNFGAGQRDEKFSLDSLNPPASSRHIRYGFAELELPMVGAENAHRGVEQLVLSASTRYEDYSDVGGKLSSKAGIVYAPTNGLRLRATVGNAFHAPALFDEFGNRQIALVRYPDPLAPGGESIQMFRSGVNPALKPETASTATVGFDLEPAVLEGATFGLTWFTIDYDDRIVTPIENQVLALSDPSAVPFIVRNPGAALQQEIIASGTEFDNFTGVPYDPATIAAFVDNRVVNATSEKARGFDLTASYRRALGGGEVAFALNASRLHLERQLSQLSPDLTVSGLVFYPPKLKARAGANWLRGGWGASAFLNYTSSETNQYPTPTEPVSAWLTADAQVSYETGEQAAALFRGLRLSLSVENLFARDPPAIASATTVWSGIGYDTSNATALGRFIRARLIKRW